MRERSGGRGWGASGKGEAGGGGGGAGGGREPLCTSFSVDISFAGLTCVQFVCVCEQSDLGRMSQCLQCF